AFSASIRASLASSAASRRSIVCRLTESVSAANSFLKCAIFRSATVLSTACLCRSRLRRLSFGIATAEKEGTKRQSAGVLLQFAGPRWSNGRIGSCNGNAKPLLVSLRDGGRGGRAGFRASLRFAAIFRRPHVHADLHACRRL